MTPRELAVKSVIVAQGYQGVTETGNNSGDQVNWFQHSTDGQDHESWCADFVYACRLKAYCQMNDLIKGSTPHDQRQSMLNVRDLFDAVSRLPRTGYCPTVAAGAVKLGWFRSKDFTPLLGDLILFDFNGQGEPHHIGFVEHSFSDGTIGTVEGNTSPVSTGSQANGGGVYRKHRNRDHVYGFVHFG